MIKYMWNVTVILIIISAMSGCVSDSDIQNKSSAEEYSDVNSSASVITPSTFSATLLSIGDTNVTSVDSSIKYRLTIKNTGNSVIKDLYIMPTRLFEVNKTSILPGETVICDGIYTFNSIKMDYSSAYTTKTDNIQCHIKTSNAGEMRLNLQVNANISTPVDYEIELKDATTVKLENNPQSTCKTNKEIFDFLRSHSVDYTKSNSAAVQVHNAAELKGIKAGYVYIKFYDSNNKEIFYDSMNVFQATDGEIFTSSVILYDHQYDFPEQLIKGEDYDFHRTITDYSDEYFLTYDSTPGIVVKDYTIYW
ncbi:MAG: hypothetical protein M0R51_11535 [Clostridia bacterium]|nr:hypothetical protein [Clostridia bacterium]